MTYTPKRWIRLGLGAALLGTASLAACSGEGGEAGETGASGPAATQGEAGEGEGGEGQAALDPAVLLPVDVRAALMAGHVAAGTALARAGEPADAAAHLSLALSEVKPGGMARLVADGLEPDLFDAAADALDDGAPAEEVEAKLAAVEANISLLQANAAGDPKEVLTFLAKRCLATYRQGVSLDNLIEDPISFQTAYGYAVVARDLAAGLESEDASGVRLELELLVRMWPDEGPVTGPPPAPLMTFAAQVSRVELELSSLQ